MKKILITTIAILLCLNSFGYNATIYQDENKQFVASIITNYDNLDSVFDNTYRTKTDEPAIFRGVTHDDHIGLQKEFEKFVKYPEKYKNCEIENCSASVEVNIEIDTFGQAKVNEIKYSFWNSETGEENINKEFYPYFAKLIDSIVDNTKWEPAVIR